MIRRGYLRKLLVVAALIFIHPNMWTFLAGVVVFLLGALLHLWTKGCLVRNEEVTVCGPYRFVRHPFYVANALIDAGICLFANSVPIYCIYPPLFFIAYARSIKREEEYLAERHGEVWLAYKKRVPMFLPYRWPAPATPGRGFRWENLVRENEVPRFIRLLAYPIFFHLWLQILAKMQASAWHAVVVDFWKMVGRLEPLALIEALIIVVLYTTAAILQRVLRAPGATETPR